MRLENHASYPRSKVNVYFNTVCYATAPFTAQSGISSLVIACRST